jgi:hypothetical protein
VEFHGLARRGRIGGGECGENADVITVGAGDAKTLERDLAAQAAELGDGAEHDGEDLVAREVGDDVVKGDVEGGGA